MKNKRLRISYSLLNLWERGQTDLATALYLHQDMPTNQAMKDGKAIHKQIEKHIIDKGKLPSFLNVSLPLTNPQPEKKIIASYNKSWDLSGVIDCLDDDFFLEFKTGTTPAFYYTRKYQSPFYFLLLEIIGEPREKSYLVKYNQHQKNGEVILLWKPKLDKVKNYIDTLAPEIEEFFLERGILNS
jgi:hypothetical protein